MTMKKCHVTCKIYRCSSDDVQCRTDVYNIIINQPVCNGTLCNIIRMDITGEACLSTLCNSPDNYQDISSA